MLADNPEDGDAQEALRVAFGAMQAPEQERQERLIESREAAGARLETQQQYRRAEELLAAGRGAEAQLALARIVNADPDFVPAALRLAEVYSATKRFDAAARLYRLIYEREPQHDEWLLRAARNLEWGEDVPGAIEASGLVRCATRATTAFGSLADTPRSSAFATGCPIPAARVARPATHACTSGSRLPRPARASRSRDRRVPEGARADPHTRPLRTNAPRARIRRAPRRRAYAA